MFSQEYYKLRLATLQQLKEGGENPYPHKYDVTISIEDFIEKYGDLKEGDVLENVTVSLAGIFLLNVSVMRLTLPKRSLER